MDNYYEKYLKYKRKYKKMKNQSAGNSNDNISASNMFSKGTVSELFEKSITYGYEVRKNGLSGLDKWQEAKAEIAKYKFDTNFEVKSSIKQLVNEIKYKYDDDISEQQKSFITLNGVVLDNQVEIHHFIVQHFRIPNTSKFKLSLLKLLQLGYNIGQAKVEFENNSYGEKVKKFYESYSLDLMLTYIEDKYSDVSVE